MFNQKQYEYIKETANTNLEAFQKKINEFGVQKELGTLFWGSNGYESLLSYLISMHVEPSLNKDESDENERDETGYRRNYREHISWLLSQIRANDGNLNAGFPLHMALEKAPSLAGLLIQEGCDTHLYDNKGLTPIAYALRRLEPDECLTHLLKKPSSGVNLPYFITIDGEKQEVQPLHHAVIERQSFEVLKQLLDSGANPNNPCGHHRQTPLLLAAARGSLTAIQALLAHRSFNKDALKNEDANGNDVVDLLTHYMTHENNSREAWQILAALICNGAFEPKQASTTAFLEAHREKLFGQVFLYLEKNPECAVDTLGQILDKETVLHAIFYGDHSVSRTLKGVFGVRSDLPYTLATLIKKVGEKLPEEQKQFAAFIEQYQHVWESDNKNFLGIKNPWSEMRVKLDKGEITTWNEVLAYANEHQSSRTYQILVANPQWKKELNTYSSKDSQMDEPHLESSAFTN